MGKQTTDRTTRARSLRAAVDTQAAEIDRRFDTLFAASLTPAQRKEIGRPSALLAAIAQTIDTTTRALEQATETHERELADDAAPRQERDEATVELVDMLVRVRRSIDSAYGRAGLTALGLSGRTPTDTPGALALAKKLRHDLSGDVFAGLTPLDETVSVNPKTWIKQLGSLTERLDAALSGVAREEREGQDTLRRKNEALTAHDHIAARGSDLIWSLLRLVDLDDAAERLVPTHRRRATEDDSEPQPEPPAPLPPA